MSKYGVTPEGFVRPRLPEIRLEIIDAMRAKLRASGLPDDIQTRPDSVMGILIDTFADREAALWEMGEGVYYAMYPGSATGVSLDRAISFTGAKRRGPERSRVYVACYGVSDTTIPDGAQIRSRATQSIWRLNGPVTISPLAASDVRIVPTPLAGETYIVTIDGVAYTYESGEYDTLAEILQGLVAVLSTSEHEVSSNGASVRILVTSKTAVAFGLTPNMQFSSVGSTAVAETIDATGEVANPGDLDTIVTLVDGWTEVENHTASSGGGAAERDPEVRARYPSGVYRLGAGTLPSIAPNIADRVSGIRAIRVYQNTSDYVDADGRLPHSVHVVVDGGIEDEIAEAIYRTVGGGIDTNGAVVRALDTPEGNQEIRFDRPTRVYVWVNVVLTLLPPDEEAFPPDGFGRVTRAIERIGQQHGIGRDVIKQRFHCGVYETPGIENADIAFAHSTDPEFVPGPEDFTGATIEIAGNERAIFDMSRIEVTG